MPHGLLAKMEAAFGADLSAVRVHVGPQAARIGAVAFTTGNDLYFAPGKFQPDTVTGQQLIGHELAHVIQQRQGRVRAPVSGVAVVQDRTLEAEADRLGLIAARHIVTAPGARSLQCTGHHGPSQGQPQVLVQQKRGTQRGQANQYRSREIIDNRHVRRAAEAERLTDQFNAVHRYVRDVIGPWATQARIAQIISEDFEAMAADAKIKEQAKTVSFAVRAGAAHTPQVGAARFVYVAPSRPKSPKRRRQRRPAPGGQAHSPVVHRGFVEQEFAGGATGGGAPCVRVYVTVFAEAEVVGGQSRFKDIQQVGGIVKIYNAPGDNTPFWMNFGQPLRALKWYEKYKYQKPTPDKPAIPSRSICSFLIPNQTYRKISGGAILENDASLDKGRSFNVDRHYASDQFGVRGDDLRLIMQAAVRGSLITYTDDMSHVTRATAGIIKTTGALRTALGVPAETIPNIWVDPNAGEFSDKGTFAKSANTYMDIYGVWFGVDEMLSDVTKRIPLRNRFEKMRRDLAKLGKHIPGRYWDELMISVTEMGRRRLAPASLAKGV